MSVCVLHLNNHGNHHNNSNNHDNNRIETVTVAGLLLARTSLDVLMLNLTTTIERAIVARNKAGFKGGMSRFARLCVPVAVVNSVSGSFF